MKKSLLFLSALMLAACSGHSGLENWKNYGVGSLDSSQLSEQQALAVFYRTADFNGPALNLFINGDYQASLLQKGYTSITLCANKHLISASYTSNKFGNRTNGVSYQLTAQETAYFRAMTDNAGKPSFERVDDAVARDELSRLSGEVTNTLPRVVHKKCTTTK